METRKATNRALELAEQGMVSWSDLAMMALKWMSEDDVTNMLRANEVFFEEAD